MEKFISSDCTVRLLTICWSSDCACFFFLALSDYDRITLLIWSHGKKVVINSLNNQIPLRLKLHIRVSRIGDVESSHRDLDQSRPKSLFRWHARQRINNYRLSLDLEGQDSTGHVWVFDLFPLMEHTQMWLKSLDLFKTGVFPANRQTDRRSWM